MSSERPRILIVGVGSIGERHVRCCQSELNAQVSICEIRNPAREAVKKKYHLHETFSDLEAALAAKPDAAIIASPANLHISMAQRVAEAGVPHLIEKPLSVDTTGVAQLEQTVRAQNLISAVAYVYRAHPALRGMKEAIASGRFGKPLQLVAVAGQDFPRLRKGYAESYYRDRATGGGIVQDALTHLTNAGEWLVGPIDELIADAEHKVLEGVEIEDTVHLLARHGEVMASYSMNQYQAPNECLLTVVCESGTCRFDFRQRDFSAMKQGSETWQRQRSEPLERDYLFEFQARSFTNAIAGHGDPLCSLSEGIQSLNVNRAALSSVESRKWQNVIQ